MKETPESTQCHPGAGSRGVGVRLGWELIWEDALQRDFTDSQRASSSSGEMRF